MRIKNMLILCCSITWACSCSLLMKNSKTQKDNTEKVVIHATNMYTETAFATTCDRFYEAFPNCDTFEIFSKDRIDTLKQMIITSVEAPEVKDFLNIRAIVYIHDKSFKVDTLCLPDRTWGEYYYLNSTPMKFANTSFSDYVYELYQTQNY